MQFSTTNAHTRPDWNAGIGPKKSPGATAPGLLNRLGLKRERLTLFLGTLFLERHDDVFARTVTKRLDGLFLGEFCGAVGLERYDLGVGLFSVFNGNRILDVPRQA